MSNQRYSPMRFGIVGCGGISHIHAQCLGELGAENLATLMAGAETDAGRRKSWAERWNVPVDESLDALLGRKDIESVIITTPSGMHGDMAVKIAKAGKHVLSEKPLDVRVEKVDAAIEAAKANKVTLGGIFQQRFTPGPQKVKRAIELGYFGEIVFVHCETPWYRAQAYYDSGDWRGTWAQDGGVLFNQAPHMIDRIIWLGGDIESITSADLKCGYQRDIEAETLAVATLRTTGGALGTITGTTLAFDGLDQRVLICGTSGSAAFRNDELVQFRTEKPYTEPDPPAPELVKMIDGKASAPLSMSTVSHRANIRDFILAVRENRTPAVTGEDQRKVVRAINLIYEKARVGVYA
jgi:predicted dehydrogenase